MKLGNFVEKHGNLKIINIFELKDPEKKKQNVAFVAENNQDCTKNLYQKLILFGKLKCCMKLMLKKKRAALEKTSSFKTESKRFAVKNFFRFPSFSL